MYRGFFVLRINNKLLQCTERRRKRRFILSLIQTKNQLEKISNKLLLFFHLAPGVQYPYAQSQANADPYFVTQGVANVNVFSLLCKNKNKSVVLLQLLLFHSSYTRPNVDLKPLQRVSPIRCAYTHNLCVIQYLVARSDEKQVGMVKHNHKCASTIDR